MLGKLVKNKRGTVHYRVQDEYNQFMTITHTIYNRKIEIHAYTLIQDYILVEEANTSTTEGETMWPLQDKLESDLKELRKETLARQAGMASTIAASIAVQASRDEEARSVIPVVAIATTLSDTTDTTNKESNTMGKTIKNAAITTGKSLLSSVKSGAKQRLGKKINEKSVVLVTKLIPETLVRSLKDSNSDYKLIPMPLFKKMMDDKVKANPAAQLFVAFLAQLAQEKFAPDNAKFSFITEAMVASAGYEVTGILEEIWDKLEEHISDAVGTTDIDALMKEEESAKLGSEED